MTAGERLVRLATRGSPLALAQARIVGDLLSAAAAATGDSVAIELVVVSTTGDERTDVPLSAIGGQGVFVKEVDAAVGDGRADAAVHSAKDLPSSDLDDGAAANLPIVAVPERADPRDALVGSALVELVSGATVATGSVRRRAQLAWLRPDLSFTELRGNIATRLDKVPPGGAVVMAKAALDRLGMADRSAQVLSVLEMLPQVGQGAIAVTARPVGPGGVEEAPAGGGWIAQLLSAIDDETTRRCVEAERAFLRAMGGGCDLPVGAHATVQPDGSIELDGMIASVDGHALVRHRRTGSEPAVLGTELALQVLASGGAALLDQFGADSVPAADMPGGTGS